MTTRLQVLRSSTSGNLPAAGTRLPGELWANFPDLQLGVIDAARNAQKLVAVRFFSTTANYAAGDFVIQAGVLYAAKGAITTGAFNVSQWNLIGSATTGPYLPLAGGTLTGVLTLQGPPANPLEAATKAYVDSGAFVPVAGGVNTGLNDNRLVNGDMRIDQRNAGASGTATGYTVDRWIVQTTQAGKGQWGRNLNAFSTPAGFPYYLGFQSAAAYTVLAGDVFAFRQLIEADMVSDFAWGTANAQSVTLSFWVLSNNPTGTFSGSVRNGAGTRSYPFTFSIPIQAVWYKIAITIPGDTAGTWALSGNGSGLEIAFDLGTGATYRGPANAWASANYVGVTGSGSIISINGAELAITGVKLETGSVATPYNRQSLAKSMADCQRYYQQGDVFVSGYGAAAGTIYGSYYFPVTMRAAPTVAYNGLSYSNTSALALNSGSAYICTSQATIAATGAGWASAQITMNAEL